MLRDGTLTKQSGDPKMDILGIHLRSKKVHALSVVPLCIKLSLLINCLTEQNLILLKSKGHNPNYQQVSIYNA